MFDVIETQTRNLKNLAHEASSYGPFLITFVTKKLSPVLDLLISRHFCSSERWKIELVLKVLKDEIFLMSLMRMRLLIKQIEQVLKVLKDEVFLMSLMRMRLLIKQCCKGI